MYYRGRIMSTIPTLEDDETGTPSSAALLVDRIIGGLHERTTPFTRKMFMFNFNRTDVKRVVCAFGQRLNVKFGKMFGTSIFTPVP